jgi:probable F420-dependent oxidoreductase
VTGVRFSMALPTERLDVSEFLAADAIAEVAAGIESAGFAACFVTDHPFADDRWLAAGGHHALDPLVVLGVAGASTTDLLLHTNIFVLPYRNPFITAKAALSVDVVSGGRLLFGVAGGYLKGEFGALGVDFDERNELVDEALAAIKAAWTSDHVAMEGRHFRARGNTMLPRPVSRPHPPIWVGGNSKRAIRRAVDHCQGWIPMFTPPGAAVRTPTVTSLDDLAERIGLLRAYEQQVGRAEPVEVVLGLLDCGLGTERFDPVVVRDQLGKLADLGVTWVGVRPEAAATPTRAAYLDMTRRFADTVLDPIR